MAHAYSCRHVSVYSSHYEIRKEEKHMKKKLPILVFTSAVLLAIALFMQVPPGHKDLSGSKLLEETRLEEVAKIIIKKGDEITTLLRSNDGYHIEEKEGFKADTAKADSLLVEVLNIKGTEWITSKKEKHEKFGLSDDNKEAIRVSLLSADNSELGGIIIGNTQKTETNNQRNYALNSSRYVRKKGSDDIFLVSRISTVQAKATDWLFRELLQIKGEEIKSIAIKHSVNKDSFELINSVNKEFEPLNFTVPAGKKLKTYVISGISNALGNLRLSDCVKNDNNAIKDLRFDKTYEAILNDGRKYEIHSAQKEVEGKTKNFIKISASFDESYKKEGEEKPEAESEAKNIAHEHNKQFSGWIYEVSSTNNFTYKKSDLFEDE